MVECLDSLNRITCQVSSRQLAADVLCCCFLGSLFLFGDLSDSCPDGITIICSIAKWFYYIVHRCWYFWYSSFSNGFKCCFRGLLYIGWFFSTAPFLVGDGLREIGSFGKACGGVGGGVWLVQMLIWIWRVCICLFYWKKKKKQKKKKNQKEDETESDFLDVCLIESTCVILSGDKSRNIAKCRAFSLTIQYSDDIQQSSNAIWIFFLNKILRRYIRIIRDRTTKYCVGVLLPKQADRADSIPSLVPACPWSSQRLQDFQTPQQKEAKPVAGWERHRWWKPSMHSSMWHRQGFRGWLVGQFYLV